VVESVAALESAGAQPDDLADLALALALVRHARTRLQGIEAALEARLVRLMPDDVVTSGRLTLARSRTSARYRAWDHGRLVRRVLPAIAVDRTTGEAGDEPTAQRVAEGLLRLARPVWRVGALAELDVDWYDLAERVPARRTVKVLGPPAETLLDSGDKRIGLGRGVS
jgi:hypothetical protein